MGRGAPLAAAVLLCAAFAVPGAARAATIPVNTTADQLNNGGGCSLREAVEAANTHVVVDGCPAGANGIDTIELPPGSYGLGIGASGEDANHQGDLDVSESLVIEGAGSGSACDAPGTTCIDANDLDRAIDVRDGIAPVALTLRGLTIADGRVVGASGGAISSQQPDATVALEGASILSSQADSGGAVSSQGALAVSESLLSLNQASGAGGAIAQGGSILTISASLLNLNQALIDGGAVAASGASTATLNSVTLEVNQALAGDGGAIAYSGTGGLSIAASSVNDNKALNGGALASSRSAAIDASTFANNQATGTCAGGKGDGGAVYGNASVPGMLVLTNSTLSDNLAACRGGGLRLFGSAVTTALTHVTLAGNSAALGGGGLDNEADAGGPSTVTLRGTILGPDSPGDCGGDGTRLSAGFNLSAGATCGLQSANGDLANTDPLLGPLRFNGGATRTRLPSTASPALNAVASGCPAPATDQRGVARPVAGRCDIGAVEAAPAPLCTGFPATIAGTPGADTITGTERRDVIAGLGGNDVIVGLGGNDLVCAGSGDDFVVGGRGNDRLRGEPGRDRIQGNGGKDVLEGGLGKDKLIGGRGLDKLKQ
jgi:CSLREA domain-containing protein